MAPAQLVAALAGAAVVAAPIAAAVALRPGANAPPAAPAATTTTTAAAGSAFPAPPAGAVVYSRELGADVLALGVVSHGARVLVQASVVGTQGYGVSGLAVSLAVQRATARAASCGAGCYRATLPVSGRPASVEVRLRGTRWRVALPSTWPPRDASALVASAGRVWRSLRSLSYRERLASGPSQAVTSRWRIEAPDRLAYQVQGGWAGVIVGSRRWDRPPGGARWTASAQAPVSQPQPFWVSAIDAHVVGTETVAGRKAWRVSFFDPGTPAWFDIALDRVTLRTLELRMITTAHFMHDVYGSFDTASPVLPPR